MTQLSELQTRWLKTRGGRTEYDVQVEGGIFVIYMALAGGGAEAVKVPEDHEILLEFNENN